jgi:ABC-2 type transport system permease protein
MTTPTESLPPLPTPPATTPPTESPATTPPVTPLPAPASTSWADPAATPASPLRAWLALVGFAARRQFRARQMILIALALLVLLTLAVWLLSQRTNWEPIDRRTGRAIPNVTALGLYSQAVIDRTYIYFLVPLWTLCFSIYAMGSERENRTLIWLTTRPLPRWSIYLGKFVALLPWTLTLNLGGLACLCLVAGEVGRQAWSLYWPIALALTPAMTALFHLLGSTVRRPAIFGLLYTFFFEGLLDFLPGNLRRFSVLYYARSMRFNAADRAGDTTPGIEVYAPASDALAWGVLLSITAVLLALGMWLFAKAEPREEV